ncbi:peptidylprolyl isomerase [Luteibacter sp. PPL201]|uniref:Peptidylprolyl isomerase n=1 Tax=Luteibacter sahnii TaxID=3021977 RepID=A0ABT6BC79_9GAMM
MIRRSTLPFVFFLGTVLATAAATADTSVATLRIGDSRLSPAQYRVLASAMAQSTGSPSFADDTDQLSTYARTEILAAKARTSGLARDPVTAERIRVAIDGVLAAAEREHLRTTARITPDDVKRRLSEHPYAYDQFALSHIFIAVGRTPDGRQRSDAEALAKARQIKKQLDDGADFATVAKAQSEDTQTASQGGELDPMLGMYMSNAFLPAVSQLHDGDVSGPVRGPNGYHILLVQQHIGATYDKTHAMIEAVLRDEAADEAIATWVRQTPVSFDKASLADQGSRAP